MIGKKIRMERIFNRITGKTLIIPIDHGISDGPIDGLIDVKKTVTNIVSGGANSIIMHKGLVEVGHREKGSDIGLIIHLSAGVAIGPDPLDKTIITSVEEAIQLGADAVSIHINLGSLQTSKMLSDAGQIGKDCKRFGLPLLMMIYPRGEKIKNETDVEHLKHAARLGAELGADIVKCPYTGDKESFREVVRGCTVPIVIAGGCKGTEIESLQKIRDAIDAGAAGVAMGRNAFQHKNPESFIKAASLVIHNGKNPKDALKEVELL
jgi:fructose-bisphosphate aldolase / 2-amino-3,7-dideoxy-D-threo-hept-6-ulosonate synthase